MEGHHYERFDHHYHGGTENVHHHIHHGGYNQYPQQFVTQPIAVVGRVVPIGYAIAQFKCRIILGVIMMVVSVPLLIAGVATITIGPDLFPGVPLLAFGGFCLLGGIGSTVQGRIAHQHYRPQPVAPSVSSTVVVSQSSTIYGPPPPAVPAGVTCPPYHQGFSTPQPPCYSP